MKPFFLIVVFLLSTVFAFANTETSVEWDTKQKVDFFEANTSTHRSGKFRKAFFGGWQSNDRYEGDYPVGSHDKAPNRCGLRISIASGYKPRTAYHVDLFSFGLDVGYQNSEELPDQYKDGLAIGFDAKYVGNYVDGELVSLSIEDNHQRLQALTDQPELTLGMVDFGQFKYTFHLNERAQVTSYDIYHSTGSEENHVGSCEVGPHDPPSVFMSK